MGIEVPNKFGAELAMPGQWETAPSSLSPSTATEDSLSIGVRKRKFEDQEEDDNEPANAPVRQGWGSRTRRYPSQDDADLDALLNGSLVKREKDTDTEPPLKSETLQPMKPDPEPVVQKMNDGPARVKVESDDVKVAEAPSIIVGAAGSGDINSPNDTPTSSTAPVFKKRKAKSQASTAVKLADE